MVLGWIHFLKEAIVDQLGFYFMAIITLSSFELASSRRSKYRTYQSLKRRSGLSCVRQAAGSGREVLRGRL